MERRTMINNKKTIFLVEDDQNMQKLIKYYLEKAMFSVESAKNGKEAIENLKELKPDLIICDIMMPIMDGFELRSRILKNTLLSTIPFLFLSARAQFIDKKKFIELGVENIFYKPFIPKNLVEKVQHILSGE